MGGLPVSSSDTPSLPGWGRGTIFCWALLACGAALYLNRETLTHPYLMLDDFGILARSWTWQDTIANLWVTSNEHSMPLGRLSTWLLIRLASRPSHLAAVLDLQGPVALLAGMGLVYLFVRREMGHPFPALLAMTLFGVCTHFHDAIFWFAASFALVGLVTTLLGLLAAQSWLGHGRYRSLTLCLAAAALAPGWFTTGLLAGPLCALYLVGPAAREPLPGTGPPPRGLRRWLPALAPLAGTALSLAITLPHNLTQILNLPRVEVEATARQTTDPIVGLIWTARALVDDVVPGLLGWPGVTVPTEVVPLNLVLLAAAGVWWWRRRAAHRRLLLLGLGFILLSYLMIFSGRAYFVYEEVHAWGRYHMYAHLGSVLFLAGGWPLRGLMTASAAGRSLWLRMAWAVVAVCALGLLVRAQLPRASELPFDPQQAADWRRVEEMDALCRAHHIDAATARQALPPFAIKGCMGQELERHVPITGWYFLRASPDPRPVTVEEARRLLQPPGEE
jgi:hypothetical protein